MKKIALLLLLAALKLSVCAQGWPYDYDGVMMQGFYWDSYDETCWSKLQAQAPEIAPYFQLIWVPQSGWCNSDYNSMGYMPVYYFNQKSSFGTETELRNMIAAYRERGTGFLADVVLNHRKNIGKDGSWVDFPVETWNGKTYQMLPSDICKNDDGGTTANWASQHGISLSQNDDTGDDWSSCRDLDHNSSNVKYIIKDYLKFLLEDIGYTGFRYDMVKGFYASLLAEYIMAVKPPFNVGEYFDGSFKISEWIGYTRGYVADYPTSGAFDFQFRYRMRDAIENNNWGMLGWDEKPIAYDNYYKQYAITFVENHDTEKRISGETQTPIWKDTLAANAFLLAMPGTPCVFYRHWNDCKYPIKQMILARHLAGITNISGSEEKWMDNNFYARVTYGKKGNLLCVVGSKPQNYSVSSSEYTEFLTGKGYRYLLNRGANTVWMDVPDGTYNGPLKVKLTAISNLSGARIVYSLDGTAPTADSPKLNSGAELSIASSCTLTAGILSNGKVYGIQRRNYEIFEPHDITLFVCSDASWPGMTFYVWDNFNKKFTSDWPGTRPRNYKDMDGKRWFYQTYSLTSPEQYLNLVVSNTSKNRQTLDIRGIREDRCLCITTDKDDGKYIAIDVTEDLIDAINSPKAEEGDLDAEDKRNSLENTPFDLQGRPVPADRKKGIVIERGKKIAY